MALICGKDFWEFNTSDKIALKKEEWCSMIHYYHKRVLQQIVIKHVKSVA
jgi:hypothetical protein